MYLTSVATVRPRHRYSGVELKKETSEWLGEHRSARDFFHRMVDSCNIEERAYGFPLSDLMEISSVTERAQLYRDCGTALAVEAVQNALIQEKLDRAKVARLIVTSCSIALLPGLDVFVSHEAGLSRSVRRLPFYQYGCAGSAAALGLIAGSKEARPEDVTLLVSAELCSLVHQPSDLGHETLLGAALFTDGAACAVLRKTPGPLRLIDSSTFLIPNSVSLLGYRVEDSGNHLVLGRDLAASLRGHLDHSVAGFLNSHGLTTKDIAWWLPHPGGWKILDTIKELFSLQPPQYQDSSQVLRSFGNMSSASLLFVVESFLKRRAFKNGDKALMIGIGPGVSIELVLLECGNPT